MQCPNCRRNIPDQTRFCGFCGAPVYLEKTMQVRRARPSGGMQSGSNPPPRRGKKTALWIVIGALLFTLLAACSFLAYRIFLSDPAPEPESVSSEPEQSSGSRTKTASDPIPAPEPTPAPEPVPEPVPEPEQDPTPAPEPEPEPTDVLGSYSYEQRKDLNVFLSNFSEVFFRSFDRNGPLDEATLVDFAFLHYKINPFGYEKIGRADFGGKSYFTISTEDVDYCLDRFMGVRVPHNGFDWYGFDVLCDGDYYYFPAATGESYNNFTVVSEAVRDGGVLRVKFDVYGLDLETYWNNDGIDEKYYAMTAAEAASNGLLEHRGSGEAVLENYTLDGSATYRLISYYGP